MDTLMNPKWTLLSVSAFAGCTLVSAWISQTAPTTTVVWKELPKLNVHTQIVHAKELLKRSPLSIKGVDDIESRGREFIYRQFQTNLPREYRWQASIIARALIDEANRYDLDPMFLMAVIKTESHFNPKARGTLGDSGLMQLLPKTARAVARELNLPEKVNLYDPVTNIRIGAAYFAQLRKHYNHVGNHYISAYNMGIGNVRKLLDNHVEPRQYAGRVLHNYRDLYSQFGASLPGRRTLVSLNDWSI